MNRDRKLIAALLSGSFVPSVLYAAINWLDYVNLRAALAEDGGIICPTGDTACANEVLGERWTDFLVSATVGSVGLFLATLAVASVILIAADNLRFRTRINSAES